MAEADRQDHCRSGGRGHCQGKRNPGQMSTAPARRKTMAGGHSGPRHVAIIMDGNGRWAKRRFLPRIIGHRRGVEAVRRVVEAAPRSEEHTSELQSLMSISYSGFCLKKTMPQSD